MEQPCDQLHINTLAGQMEYIVIHSNSSAGQIKYTLIYGIIAVLPQLGRYKTQ